MPTSSDKSGGGLKRVRRPGPKTPEAAAAVVRPASIQVSVPHVVSPPRPARFVVGGGLRRSDITVFLRQLILLLDAGTPLQQDE